MSIGPFRMTYIEGFGPFCPDCCEKGVRLGSHAVEYTEEPVA